MRASHIARLNPRRTSFFRRTWNSARDELSAEAQEWAYMGQVAGQLIQEEIEISNAALQNILQERARHLLGGPVNQDISLEEKQEEKWVDLEAQPPPRKPKRQSVLPYKATKYQKGASSMEVDLTPLNPAVVEAPTMMDLDQMTVDFRVPTHSISLNLWDAKARLLKKLKVKKNLLQKLKYVLLRKPRFINKKKS